MKPLHLKISAFGPFADLVEVPFEEIGAKGLFLITGDTGAGKTTIFDAIVFALYGEMSGSHRAVNSVRSDFAKADIKTAIELTFKHKGRIFKVLRQPAQKTKKRDGSYQEKSAEAVLYEGNEEISNGVTNVNVSIGELLKMDKQQFKQISMIAQNEFLQLLYAKSKDRSDILRKIFQTNIYENFQKEVAELHKEAMEKILENKILLLQFLKEVKQEEVEEADIYKAEEILKEYINKMNVLYTELEEDTKKENSFSLQLEKIAQQISIIQSDNERILKRKEQKEIYNRLIQEKEEREIKRAYLQKQTIVMDEIEPIERKYKELKRKIKDEKIEAKNKSERLKSLELMLQEKELEKNTMEKQKPQLDEERVHLQQLYDVKELWKQKEGLKQTYQKALEKKESFLNLLQINGAEQKRLLQDIAEKEKYIEKKTELAKEIEQKKGYISLCDEKCLNLQDMLTSYQENETRKAKREELRIEYKQLNQNLKKAKREKEESYTKMLEGYIYVLSSRLKDGEPCSVCGSLHHPKQVVSNGELVTEQMYKEKEMLFEKWKKECDALYAEGTQLTSLIDEMEEKLRKKCEDIGLELEGLNNSLDDKLKEKQTYLKEQNSLMKQQEEIYVYESEWNELKEKLATMEEQANQIKAKIQQYEEMEYKQSGELSTIEKQIEKWNVQTKEEVEQLIQTKQRYIQKTDLEYEMILKLYQEKSEEVVVCKVELIELNKQIDLQKKEESTKQESYMLLLEEYAFETEEAYERYKVKDIEQFQERMRKNQEYFIELDQVQQYLNFSEDIADKMEIDIHELQIKQATYKEEIQSLKQYLEEKKETYHLLKRGIENIQHTWQDYEMLREECKPIEELYSVTNGKKNGKETFESFVQGFYFEQILKATNIRLEHMTQGRYALQKTSVAERGNSTINLDIEVYDKFTGKIRPVKSLSGGEAFKASLSLALGLSDMIQSMSGGVVIETMFIDEGFGSLDEKSREQAIEELQKLIEGNRLIGVISHITEIKERIENKIIVNQTASGSQVEYIYE